MTDTRRDEIADHLAHIRPYLALDKGQLDQIANTVAAFADDARKQAEAALAQQAAEMEQLRADNVAEIESLQRMADLCRDKDWAEIARLRAVNREGGLLISKLKRENGRLRTAWASARIGRARYRALLREETGHSESFAELAGLLRGQRDRAEAELGARKTTVAQLRAAHRDLARERGREKERADTYEQAFTAACKNDEVREGHLDLMTQMRDSERGINEGLLAERDRFKDTLTRIRTKLETAKARYEEPAYGPFGPLHLIDIGCLLEILNEPEEGTDDA